MNQNWKVGDKVRRSPGIEPVMVIVTFERLFDGRVGITCQYVDDEGKVRTDSFTSPDMLVDAE